MLVIEVKITLDVNNDFGKIPKKETVIFTVDDS